MNAFVNYFDNIISTLKKKAFPLINYVWSKPGDLAEKTEKIFNFRTVTPPEVKRQLKSIKRSKATGIDDLPPGLLKDSAEIIAAPLTYIVNLSLSTGVFPKQWKRAKIIPVFKSGSATDFDSYRPITVLPVISKVMEKVVYTVKLRNI